MWCDAVSFLLKPLRRCSHLFTSDPCFGLTLFLTFNSCFEFRSFVHHRQMNMLLNSRLAERQTGAAVVVTSTQFQVCLAFLPLCTIPSPYETSSLTHTQIAAILLFSLALLSIFTRILLKIQLSRIFNLDDYMLFLSTICFTAGTGLIFHDLPMQDHLGPLNGVLTLFWTTTFLARFSILGFLRGIVIAMKSKKMVWYYEITVGVCVVSWVYVVAAPFMAEPDSGLYVGLTYAGTVMDVLSVLMGTYSTLHKSFSQHLFSYPRISFYIASLSKCPVLLLHIAKSFTQSPVFLFSSSTAPISPPARFLPSSLSSSSQSSRSFSLFFELANSNRYRGCSSSLTQRVPSRSLLYHSLVGGPSATCRQKQRLGGVG